MEAELIDQLISNIEIYGPIAVIIWMFLEEFIPVPSAIAPMAAGFLLINTNEPFQAFLMVLLLISILGSAASVLSSYVLYSLGLYGGRPAIERYGKYIRVNWHQVQALNRHLTSGKEHYVIAMLRAIPLVPLSVISASAGFFRVNWKKYGLWSFIGMIPRNLSLGMLGWYMAEDFQAAALLIGKISTTVFITGTAIILFYFIYRKEELEHKYATTKGLIT